MDQVLNNTKYMDSDLDNFYDLVRINHLNHTSWQY